MSNYDFEKLDSKEFERLANALCVKFISRGADIFGSGTDGGREATYQGKMDYPTDKAQWDGYLVVQCKQREKLGRSLGADTTWALTQLKSEMKMYEDAVEEREKPEYFLFITNVELSAKRNSGGKDKFLKLLEEWRKKLGIREAHLWDRDKLSSLLDGSQEIARRFGQLLPGDLIHASTEYFLSQRTDIKAALYVFLQAELRSDQFVSLSQAGHTTEDQPPLARVFVDLRATTLNKDGKTAIVHVVDAVQRAADRSVAPTQLAKESLTTSGKQDNVEEEPDYSTNPGSDELFATNASPLEPAVWQDPSRFVFIGGPGQGKSTVAQYLAQRHRAALLTSTLFTSFEADVDRIVSLIQETAEEMGVGLPKHTRLPFRIVLERFADALAKDEVTSVLDYIALLIHTKSGMPFTRNDAAQLLTEFPLLVAFDGLDEVPAASNRPEVVEAVIAFLAEARYRDADLLIVATTRPQGYGGEFSPAIYNHLTLNPLSKSEALAYAKKLVEAKYVTRIERREIVLQRLEKAADDEAILRLMQSPLQVTIMAVLVEIVGNLPRERFVLFQRYYDIIYQREQERGGELSDVLVRHRTNIEIIHDNIGLKLQIEAETAADSNKKTTRQSRVSLVELQVLVREYLIKKGFEGADLIQAQQDIMTVALERLVFIVVFERESYGFEVRSLQEFSAARALMRGEYTLIRKRLRAISDIPYWLNTMLFAVGRAFSVQDEEQCTIVLNLCNELNNEDADILLVRTLAGSRLALEILEDGVGEAQPMYRRLFFETAFRLLTLPHKDTAVRLAELYTPAYDGRYQAAAQAAIGATEQTGLFILLAILASREIVWAKELLEQLWPVDAEIARSILEQIAGYLTWNKWQVKMIERVASQSSLDWSAGYLHELTPVPWIDYAQRITHANDARITFNSEAKDFSYTYISDKFNEEILDGIKQANPIHTDWLPFALGSEFIREPTADTLANALEAIALDSRYEPNRKYYYGTPWQLAVLINETNSATELLAQARRARQGELGNTDDWLAAEARWEKEGCSIEDFQVFSDAEWPFTSDVAQHGIVSMSGFSVSMHGNAFTATENDLLRAFNTATSERIKPEIAAGILFLRRCASTRTINQTYSIETVVKLVTATRRSVTASVLLSLLEPDLDWVGIVNELNFIGSRISWLYDENTTLLNNMNVEDYVIRLTAFLPGKPVREGILRLLAGLISAKRDGGKLNRINIAFESLSPAGQVALMTITLFSETATPADVAAQQITSIWSAKSGVYDIMEMPNVIRHLLERDRLSAYQISILGHLVADRVVEARIKQKIIESLILQTQYRASGLESEEMKQALKITA